MAPRCLATVIHQARCRRRRCALPALAVRTSHGRAQIPGATLPPGSIPKYRTPLLVPPAMPRAGKLKVKGGGKNIDYYEIAVRQFEQQILPAGLPATTVWGYGPRVAQGGPSIFNAPSLTIEAKHGTPVRVKWVNELRVDPADPTSAYLPHLLPVDPTLHWANPPGGTVGRDMRPGLRLDARPLHRPGPHRDPRPRLGRRRRRERRLRRGLVPAPGREHPGRLRHRGHLVRLLPGQGGEPRLRRARHVRVGAGNGRLPVSRTASARRRSGTTTTRWA